MTAWSRSLIDADSLTLGKALAHILLSCPLWWDMQHSNTSLGRNRSKAAFSSLLIQSVGQPPFSPPWGAEDKLGFVSQYLYPVKCNNVAKDFLGAISLEVV